MRKSGRTPQDLRAVEIIPNYLLHAEGSVLVSFGHTKVICTASSEDRVPPHLMGTGKGWVTAEYGMLPRSTHTRNAREAARGKQGGRTLEIQRLIGRSLRAATDLDRMGTMTITVDCDVIQADGGTRTAAITGGFVALSLAVQKLMKTGKIRKNPILGPVAAISAGVIKGVPVLDLDYEEDSTAEVDMNIVANGEGALIEVQGTAEGKPFPRQTLDALVDLGLDGVRRLVEMQKQVLGG